MADERARGDETLDRRGFLSGVGRRWRWILVGTLAGLLASAVFLAAVPPRYAGVAKVVLDPPHGSASGPAAAPDDAAAGTQAESLATDDIARAAVAKLGLVGRPEFRNEGASDTDAVAAFLSRLSVKPSPRSRVIEITFVSREPELAARGANTVAELAVESAAEARAKTDHAEGAWLAWKIEDKKGKVADAEARVDAFRAQSGLLSGADARPSGSDQPADLDAKLAAARAAEAAAAGKADLLRKLEREGGLAEAPASIGDESLRRLLDQRGALRAEIAEASRTLLPLHPRMKDLASQLASLDVEIRDAADKAARASETEARQAGAEASAIAATLAERSKTAAAAPAAAASLHALESAAQAARDELASYQQMAREEEARAAAEDENGGGRIVARAEPPKDPEFPKAGPTLLSGAAAGFVLSTLAAAMAASVARGGRPRSPSAPENPEMTEGAAAPTAVAEPETAANSESSEPAPSAGALGGVDGLVARLRRLKPKDGLAVLIAGDRSGQALTIALETARRFAAEQAAVFVDLGETQDWLADILYHEEPDEPPVLGLSDLIAGRAGFADVIGRDLSSSLDVVLPGRGGVSGRVDDALSAFAAAYPVVVLHASNWRVAWPRAAAAFADAVVVVAPAARAQAALDAAEAALGDACPTFLAFPLKAAQKAPEPVD